MKYLILFIVPCYLWSAEQEIEKLLAERAQIEIINSELQSEIRSSTNERDRMNDKISSIEDELKEIRRKLNEAKIKRNQWLKKLSKTGNESDNYALNPKQVEQSMSDYEVFVSQGLPWKIGPRTDKIKALKSALHSSKESINETILQWSQFLETERKLASETDRSIQRLTIENGEVDASIFRLGLTVLYYKTAQGQTGIYYRKNNRLFHQKTDGEKIRDKIIKLVESGDEKSSGRLLSELVLTPGMTN